MGRISGRPRGIPVAAYGENLMATHTLGVSVAVGKQEPDPGCGRRVKTRPPAPLEN